MLWEEKLVLICALTLLVMVYGLIINNSIRKKKDKHRKEEQRKRKEEEQRQLELKHIQLENERLQKELEKERIVKENSTKLAKMQEIRKEHQKKVKHICHVYTKNISTTSTQQFKSINDNHAKAIKLAYKESEYDKLQEIVDDALENKRVQQSFMIAKNHIEKEAEETDNAIILETGLSIDEFKKIENSIMYREMGFAAFANPEWVITVKYESPTGRNKYKADIKISIKEMQNFLQSHSKKSHETDEKKIERAKMSNSLRYDILKRDGFKCQLCGRSADDGVTLEVDHIVPISKGGKTVAKNLRTLCKDCNRGKRDKIE